MWYLDHFKLTPFDDRYLKVPYEWMEFSYLKSMNSLSAEEVRHNNIKLRIEQLKEKEKEEELEAVGSQLSNYSDEEREAILQAFRDAK